MIEEIQDERYPDAKMVRLNDCFGSLSASLESDVRESQQGRVGERSLEAFRAFEMQVWQLINILYQKKPTDAFSADFYARYFKLLQLLEQRQREWPFQSKQEQPDSPQRRAALGQKLVNIIGEMCLIICSYLCNSVKVTTIHQQEIILRNVAKLYEVVLADPKDFGQWQLINDLLGFGKGKRGQGKPVQEQRFISRFNPHFRIDDFVAFNVLSSLYSSLRTNFPALLRKAFVTVAEGGHEEIWDNLEGLLFPPVNINGCSIFNGKVVEKSKEGMALGIFLEQYLRLTEIIIESKEGLKTSIAVTLELEKRKILLQLFEMMKVKSVKIVEKARNNPPINRFRARQQQQSVEDVIQSLIAMDIERDYAEIALENIEVPDQNLALEWIDNNRALVEEQVMIRAIERSNESRNNLGEKRVYADGVAEVNMERFRQEVSSSLRGWIKFAYKELFQGGEESSRIKDVLFLCMDFLQENAHVKQYINFNDKIYKDLDELNKESNVTPKLRLLVEIMESLANKLPRFKTLFYDKAIHMKSISFLNRVETQDQSKIFSLLNSYLPTINPGLLTVELEEYLAYLLDLIYQYKPTGKSIMEIFYKALWSGSQTLINRTTRNLIVYLQEKLVSDNIVPIIYSVLNSDATLRLVNAELDVKTYLFDRYRHIIRSFHPDKQHVIRVNIKEFSASFSKYENGTVINEVGKRLFGKKKNDNKFFFFDCRKPGNELGFSLCANIDFISYPLRTHQKNIIRSLLSILFRSGPESQDELLAQLHRILGYFRLLLPFVLREKVDGNNLLEWLLDCPSQSKRKYKLLEFLLLNCNILVKDQGPYSFYSIADYACARVVSHLSTRDYQDGQYHPILACLYLQQVRKFSQFCATPFSSTCNDTLASFFERLFERATPLQYLAISEFLNIQYKRILLNNLKRKYKIIGSETEPTFERQFLNISAFYNSLSVRVPESNPNPNSNLLNAPQIAEMPVVDNLDSEQEENQENIGHIGHAALLYGGNRLYEMGGNIRVEVQDSYEHFIAPLPQKPSKEGEVQPLLQPIVFVNSFTVTQILDLFEEILSLEMEIQDKVAIVEVGVPQKAIKMPENLPFKVKLTDSAIDLEMRVKKNTIFERHFGEIMQIFDPKIVWEERRAAFNLGQRLQDINRLLQTGEHSVAIAGQLERLRNSREYMEEEAGQPLRLLNTADIYNNAPEFIEPIIPVVPVVAPVDNQPQIPIEPVVNGIVEPNQPEPIKVEEAQQVLPVVPEPMDIEGQPQQENQEVQIVEVPLVVPVVEPIVEQPQPNQPVQLQVQQAPVIPPPAENPPQPPIKDRQILRVFGLPQTFLRDSGIDEESFDCLPEDFQQEQLMHFISQQNQALSRSNQAENSNNANNPNNNGNNPVADLQNDNVAFLASLDIHTRAQVLIEATPQFLSTLPASIRAEAENYRHQQVNRMVEQEEIEEERKITEKLKLPTVYPKVLKEEFSRINDITAKRIFEGIFYVYPNFKLPAVKILLQNKHSQGKTIASIIAILRYLEIQEENRQFSLKKVERSQASLNITEYFQWSQQETKNVRLTLLHTIYESLRIPFYKDEQIFSQSLPIELYFENLRDLFEGEESIRPELELFEFSLKYYPALCSELIKKIKDLPDKILVKIVEGMKANSFAIDFYDNLQNFSENERLKQLFNSQFHQERPKIQILGKLLKYSFSHVPSLRRIHQEALEKFSNTYYQFLNQIFRIYTLQSLQEIEPILLKHKKIHFEVIKYLLQLNKEIEKEPIGILLKRPQLLDFETKKFIFRNHPHLRKMSRRRVQIEVDRAHLFQGSYNQLMSRSVRELEGRIQVSFVNEPGYDAGGLKREWFLVVSREIFNQDYALFQKSSSGSTYQPNPKSYINPDHLNYFKFIGRFIGKALIERELIDAYFTRAFYKMILGQELEFKDLEAQDYEFYKSMQWLMANPIDENMFTFSYIYDNFGNRIEKELVPGGKEIIVNEENKKEYIEKFCHAKMRDGFSAQINKFLEGFHEIVPQECISYFEAKELELLISGVPEVDVEDLKQNTDYSGYAPTDQIIIWFWEVVETYSQQDLAKLVQFITGTSKIPVEGFSQLVGMNGIQRISIHRDPYQHQLPKSHTCFNQLDLPNYPTKEVLKQKLSICLAWGSEGFGFM